eukprot:TRINITY_DN9370_c0_g1_i2.p1 TRINITY_DN9370_c0_g1~~TRINITY_DN9370_c0_g1_i2.p1  ORF type:complete len:310 (+),score=52.82 TRINITY_DN9370_c0_g1_i2:45-974(+)
MCVTFFFTTMSIVRKRTEELSQFLVGNALTLPFEGFACGYVAGGMGRALVMPLDAQGLSPLATMVKGRPDTAAKAAILYRYSPYWGIRLAVYTHSLEHYGGKMHGMNPVAMAPYFFVTGAWTECWTRAIVNPINKLRYTRDMAQLAGDKSASLISAAKTTWSTQGALGLFQDVAKYRVEAPKMGVLFMVYHTLRNTILSLAAETPAEASMAVKIPVDLACGGLAGAAAVAATHGLRASSYDASSVYAAKCMRATMMMEAPLAAFVFAAYGVMMPLLTPPENDAGLSGWSEEESHLSQYGGKKRSLEILG